MNAAGKTIDKTFLSINNAEERGFIHRDYIAHCLRWTHVVKRLYERKTYETARILDIGCGRELPLAKLLYSSKLIPQRYTGVDVGPINDADYQILMGGKMKDHVRIFEHTNLLDLHFEEFTQEGSTEPELPNMVTCFEVLEHVEPKMMFDMLTKMKELTTDDATFFISTPNWNRTDCAANHVNEMLYEALGAGFERHGFAIQNVYGTFASIRDYEHLLARSPEGLLNEGVPLHVFDKLREYYDTNFLSCVFAPLFPAQSRNALWELRKESFFTPRAPKRFKDINSVQQPWSSSEQWKDMSL